MIINSIPEHELKQLISFLRVAIKPDLEFQAVYQKVMHSPSIQVRLFEALTNKTDSFIAVYIKRKTKKIPLYFSQDMTQVIDSVTNSSTINTQAIDYIADSIKNLNATQSQVTDSVTNSSTTITQPIDFVTNSNTAQIQVIDSSTNSNIQTKRKGRGKAKKLPPSRTLISVLVDDSCINKLDELATKYDMNFSQVVRAALLFYLRHKA